MRLSVCRNKNNVVLLKEPEFRTVLVNKVATDPIGYLSL